ncbi:parallel beta-helix domain-containing protein [Henriciella marina]|uniref:parallel beta-helix domain-containing protein n=1 Tax=Henriciella marina TaxID=453851 RepID=UPI00035D732D|nr:parallel beta-helix domain-containing protein [Henriciella marina]
MRNLLIAAASISVLAACGGADETVADGAEPGSSVAEADAPAPTLEAGADFQERLQTALILAEEGSTIVMPAGTFEMTDGLTLDVHGVTLRGASQAQTILNFSQQRGSGEGLLVTSDDVTLSDFTIQETKGDGIKSKGADRIIYRNIKVEWLGDPDEASGAYGIYPVESSEVLVEASYVRGASDAGIYVGQSDNIVVRDNIAEYNVAGIEIENSTNALVNGNVVSNNTGGILVFDLPDLPVMGGNSTIVRNNAIQNNNTRNFAPPGNIVAGVPSGTGVIIMANDKVLVKDNRFENNQTADILITAYSQEFSDEDYNPLPRNVEITGNTYDGSGENPQGDLAQFASIMGGKLPPIVWDGVTRWGDEENSEINIFIDEPESVGYVNLGLGSYPIDVSAAAPSMDRPGGESIGAMPGIVLSRTE